MTQLDIETQVAYGRQVGVTQLTTVETGDGRTVRLDPEAAELRSFATCSYLNLQRDPRVTAAAISAVERFGVSFGASRSFVMSPLYPEAEDLLERIFRRPVVLAGSTTLAHGAALPVLLDSKDAVLCDRFVHHSVQTALASLGARGPRATPLPHSDLNALEYAVRAAIAGGAHRVWYCADGVYSMFGDRLPVEGLAALMRRYQPLHAYLDDAHGMSWCGTHGAGTLLDTSLQVERTVIATSLSKGFGCAGGLIAVPDMKTKHRIADLGPSLMFSIQLPPPILGAICASARIHLSEQLPAMQRELADLLTDARDLLRDNPSLAPRVPVLDGLPTPVHYVVLGGADLATAATLRLQSRGFLVNPVAYPAVPRDKGGIRFTITRAHTLDDVVALVDAVTEVVRECCPTSIAAPG